MFSIIANISPNAKYWWDKTLMDQKVWKKCFMRYHRNDPQSDYCHVLNSVFGSVIWCLSVKVRFHDFHLLYHKYFLCTCIALFKNGTSNFRFFTDDLWHERFKFIYYRMNHTELCEDNFYEFISNLQKNWMNRTINVFGRFLMLKLMW